MPELSLATKKLIRQYQNLYLADQPKEGLIGIHVDEIASKLATLYEQIRKVVDWREEHLMKRIAIERILKRRMFLLNDSEGAAEPFVMELIRGGHLPNDQIEKSKVKKVQKAIDKYSHILKNLPPPPKNKNKSQFYTHILSIAACEVEEIFSSAARQQADALIEYEENLMISRIKIGRRAARLLEGMEDDTKATLVYIGVQEALFSLDPPIITYNLLKRKYQDWNSPSDEHLREWTEGIYRILDDIDRQFNHPLADKIYNLCELYDTPCLLLGDVIAEDPFGIVEKISEPEELEKLIKKAYDRRLKTLKKRSVKAATLSTVSIFASNVVSLYGLEFPFAKYVMGNINVWAAIFDIVGPTVLMFLMAGTIKLPKRSNLQLVLDEVGKNVYEDAKKDVYEVELYPKRSWFFRLIIGLLYIGSFFVSFGSIIWILRQFDYPPLSYCLLIMFTALIMYTGLKIRQKARELHVTPKKETVFSIIFDPFAMPVVYLGRHLSSWWKRYNIIGVAFNLLLDTPFLTFVEFIEQWRYFLKEQKDKIH